MKWFTGLGKLFGRGGETLAEIVERNRACSRCRLFPQPWSVSGPRAQRSESARALRQFVDEVFGMLMNLERTYWDEHDGSDRPV